MTHFLALGNDLGGVASPGQEKIEVDHWEIHRELLLGDHGWGSLGRGSWLVLQVDTIKCVYK